MFAAPSAAPVSGRALETALATDAPVILVAAPAGFGKTALLRELANRWRQQGQQVTWREAHLGASVPANTITLIDEDATIDCERFEALLARAVDGRRFVVTARSLPSMDWLSLQLKGRVLLVSADNLRLTREETHALLQTVAPGQFDAADAEWLHRETTGWAAAIEGAARLGAREQPGRADRLRFAVTPGSTAAFFEQSVDRVLPPHIAQFLSEAAVLDLLSHDLVDELFGHDGTAHFARCRDEYMLMATSERSHFFELPPILRRHIREAHPVAEERRRALLLQASSWHLERDMADVSIDYLLQSRRPDEAAAVLAKHGPRIRTQTGDNPKMLQWLDRIIVLGGRIGPELQLWRVWGLVYSQRLDEGETTLETLMPELDQDDRRNIAFAERLRVSIAARRDDIALTEQKAERWMAQWAERDPVQAAGVALILALVHAYRQDDRPCRRMLLASRQHAVHGGNDAANLWVMGVEALVELGAGRTLLALDIIERAQSIAARVGGAASPVSKMLSVIAALVHLELDDLDAVSRDLAHGYASTPTYGLPVTHLAAQEAMTGFSEQRSGVNAALLNIHQEGISGWRYAQAGHLLAVRLLVRAGRVDEARARFEAVRDAMSAYVDDRSQQEFNAAEAWIRFAERDHAGAKALLLPLLAFADMHGQRRRFTSLLLLRSACEWEAGESQAARRCFSRAIGIASSGQLMRTVIDLGWALRDLLAHIVHEEEISTEADRFLRQVRERLGVFDPAVGIAAPLEPVTGRELDVIRLLDSGLRAKDIAGRLGMEMSTLKWHIQNIYGKLDVRNRPGAVAAARRFGLI